MSRLKTTTSILLLIAVAIPACSDFGWIDLTFRPAEGRRDTGEARLNRVMSAQEWVDFFRDQVVAQRERSDPDQSGPFDDLDGFFIGRGAPEAAGDGATATSGESTDFTSTNIQQIGVDESDVIKTDGEYFYMVVGGELRIVKAYPSEQLAELSAVQLDEVDASALYLDGDRVIAITAPPFFCCDTDFPIGVAIDDTTAVDADDAAAPPAASQADSGDEGFYADHSKTGVALIDVSDPVNPEVLARWSFDGRYVDSRMIDGVLHLITHQVPYVSPQMDPQAVTVEHIADYMPRYSASFADGTEQSGPIAGWEDFYHPVDPDGYRVTSVISLDTRAGTGEFSTVAVMADPGTIYASTTALYVTDPAYDYFNEYRETLDIHKFDLTNDGARYVASGSVEGRLVNQFSMGDHQDHLQVATTTGWPWAWDGDTSKNHVFVLAQGGSALDVAGAIRDLAPGEQIYSARFMGPRGFVVTFRQVDPLFALDLSIPTAPRVAGELKITGFSEYIHVMDDDHLLTLGRAATDEGMILGLQLSIFDVSDLGDPQQVATRIIGGPGSSSEAEHNHKAFTYYAAQQLLAIPVVAYGEDGGMPFSGLQVFDVSTQDGINMRGQITTTESTPFGYPAYWGWSRGIFIDRTVYAATEVGVKAASIEDPNLVTAAIDIEGSPHVDGEREID